jgi:hypothetical protein
MQTLDEFSKLLAESVSRRQSLRRISTFVAGAVLSPLGLRTALAAGPDRCLAFCRCSNKTQQNQCLAACRECNANTSRLCGGCGSYACCDAATTCCNGVCTDVNSDRHNCGACGNACAASTPLCYQGACNACPSGSTYCGAACIDTDWDSLNCGGCGNDCGPLYHCAFGVCEGVCIGCE